MRSVRRPPHTDEHMFPFTNTRQQGFITVHPALRRAADLARAFVLLEDPELSRPLAPAGGSEHHPHRAPLRPLGGATRRPGAGVPREQRCLTPIKTVSRPAADRRWQRTEATGKVARCASSPASHPSH